MINLRFGYFCQARVELFPGREIFDLVTNSSQSFVVVDPRYVDLDFAFTRPGGEEGEKMPAAKKVPTHRVRIDGDMNHRKNPVRRVVNLARRFCFREPASSG